MSARTDTERRAAVEHATALITDDGLTANQAAKTAGDKAGVSGRTVKRWAQDTGTPLGALAQDTAEKARDVAAAQYEARRAAVRLRFLEAIEHIIDRIYQPHYDYKSAGRDGIVRVEYDEAPDGAVKNYVTAAAIALDKIRLEEGKATSRTSELPALSDVESWLAEVEAQKAAESAKS